MDLRLESIILETDRWRIEGQLTLPAEGYRSRLSDYVNQRDREFFSIQDATLTSLDRPDDVEARRLPFVGGDFKPEEMPVPFTRAGLIEAAATGRSTRSLGESTGLEEE